MNKKIILLVEDNPDDEELTLRAIQQCSGYHELVVKRDGEEVLDYLFGTGKFIWLNLMHLPNLILLDLKLPKMDGLEVLERLRADPHTRHIPVVILTSSNERKDILLSYSLGANSYVCKPVEFQRFSAVLQQLTQYWMQLNEAPPVSS